MRVIAEFKLRDDSENASAYLQRKQAARVDLEAIHASTRKMEEETLSELPDNADSRKIARFHAQDQAPKYFLYAERHELRKSDPVLYEYLERISHIDECTNVNAAGIFYMDYLFRNGWPLDKQTAYFVFHPLVHVNYNPELLMYTRHLLQDLLTTNRSLVLRDYVDLTDKILINQGKQQHFGTFITCIDGKYQPVGGTDVEKFEKNRRELGLRTYKARLADFPEPTCDH